MFRVEDFLEARTLSSVGFQVQELQAQNLVEVPRQASGERQAFFRRRGQRALRIVRKLFTGQHPFHDRAWKIIISAYTYAGMDRNIYAGMDVTQTQTVRRCVRSRFKPAIMSQFRNPILALAHFRWKACKLFSFRLAVVRYFGTPKMGGLLARPWKESAE